MKHIDAASSLFKIVIPLGAPGIGKGTVSGTLQKHYGFRHFQMSQLLKQKASQDAEVREAMYGGGLVTDNHIVPLADEVFEEIGDPFVGDGFFRSGEQILKGLNTLTRLQRLHELIVFRFTGSFEEVCQRIIGRFEESIAQVVREYQIPEELVRYIADQKRTPALEAQYPWIKLIRPDDHPKVVPGRITLYNQRMAEMEPVLQLIPHLIEVDAMHSEADVFRQVGSLMGFCNVEEIAQQIEAQGNATQRMAAVQ